MSLFVSCDSVDTYNVYSKAKSKTKTDRFQILFPVDVLVRAGESKLIDFQISCVFKTLSKKTFTIGNELFSHSNFLVISNPDIYKTDIRFSCGLMMFSSGDKIQIPVDNISDEDISLKKGINLFDIIISSLEEFSFNVVKPTIRAI